MSLAGPGWVVAQLADGLAHMVPYINNNPYIIRDRCTAVTAGQPDDRQAYEECVKKINTNNNSIIKRI